MSDAILWFFSIGKARQKHVAAAVAVLRKAGIAADEALCMLHVHSVNPSSGPRY